MNRWEEIELGTALEMDPTEVRDAHRVERDTDSTDREASSRRPRRSSGGKVSGPGRSILAASMAIDHAARIERYLRQFSRRDRIVDGVFALLVLLLVAAVFGGSWYLRDVQERYEARIAAPPGWSDNSYLATNPDVAEAVQKRRYSSGWQHYQMHGKREGRPGAALAP